MSVATETITIDIQAFTDGRDLLVIQGNNEPTIITTTLDGVTQLDQYDWYPSWPAPLDTGQWGTGNSSIFSGLTPHYQAVT